MEEALGEPGGEVGAGGKGEVDKLVDSPLLYSERMHQAIDQERKL